MFCSGFKYALFAVENDKVVNDRVDWQRNRYHATQKADCGVTPAQRGFWVDVSITYSCHSNDGPPEGLRDAGEHGLRVALLHRVPQRGKQKNSHAHVHEQQAQLLQAAL